MKKITLILFITGIVFIIFFKFYNINKSEIKSVIIISIDTLRADHLSCYGYNKLTSPGIDKFAKEGVLFKHSFSASPQTAPSHASIFTGKYPSFHSVGVYNGTYMLLNKEITLAELCKSTGMKTAAIVSNPILKKNLGLIQGFDTYDDRMDKRELNRGILEQTADDAVDKAIIKLKTLKDSKFFFFLHIQDPHGPYLPHEGIKVNNSDQNMKLDKKFLPISDIDFGLEAIPFYQKYKLETSLSSYVDRYDEEIKFMDIYLNKLFNFLKENGMFENSLIILTADHGEAFGEDGFYFVHGHSCGMEQVHIPLIIAGPKIRKGMTFDKFAVSNIDIFSTVIDFLNISPPDGIQSHSLKKILFGDSDPKSYPVYFESRNQRGISVDNMYLRRDRYKLGLEDYYINNISERQGRHWSKGFIRLGEQYISFEKRKRSGSGLLRKKLRKFSKKADEALLNIDKKKKMTIRSMRLRRKLRSLGYIN